MFSYRDYFLFSHAKTTKHELTKQAETRHSSILYGRHFRNIMFEKERQNPVTSATMDSVIISPFEERNISFTKQLLAGCRIFQRFVPCSLFHYESRQCALSTRQTKDSWNKLSTLFIIDYLTILHVVRAFGVENGVSMKLMC